MKASSAAVRWTDSGFGSRWSKVTNMKLIGILAAAVAFVSFGIATAQPPPQPYVYEIQSITGAATGCVAGYGVACTDLTSYPHIYVDGYTEPGDGGGGYIFLNNTNCGSGTANGGTIINDDAPTKNCFYRANPTNDVHDWGAKCNVV